MAKNEKMKKNYFLGLIMLLTGYTVKSQITLDTIKFESLLTQVDTFWNGSDLSGGFSEGPSYRFQFINNYDTNFNSWDGFSYSSMTDTTTPGFTNQYSCIAGEGVFNSTVYAVGYVGYTALPTIDYIFPIRSASSDSLIGVWVNNTTYAYLSMLNGDSYAKKFGDTLAPGDTVADGTNGEDWCLLTIYDDGGDSVNFYLADYRFANDSLDYIVKDWTYVDLSSFSANGPVLQLTFKVTSSDNHPTFGMRTPAYFCLDNLEAYVDNTGSIAEKTAVNWNVYPNPTVDYLNIEIDSKENLRMNIITSNGQLVASNIALTGEKSVVDFTILTKGVYIVQLVDNNGVVSSKQIIKQ